MKLGPELVLLVLNKYYAFTGRFNTHKLDNKSEQQIALLISELIWAPKYLTLVAVNYNTQVQYEIFYITSQVIIILIATLQSCPDSLLIFYKQ